MSETQPGSAPPSTSEIVAKTLRDARELAQVEARLAGDELRREGAAMRRAGIELAIAFACFVLAVSSLVTSIAIARRSALLELAMAIVFLVIGAVVGGLGYKNRPRAPLRPARDRLATDVDKIKEHLA
jgi:uncharacterized membrane protein YqjE